MRRASDWFVLVASDLFMACFAAILVIDIISPKFPEGEIGSVIATEFAYSLEPNQTCNTRDFQKVAFKVNDGADNYTTFDLKSVYATTANNHCIVTGKLEDIGANIEKYCLLVVGGQGFWPKNAEITLSNGAILSFEEEKESENGGPCA